MTDPTTDPAGQFRQTGEPPRVTDISGFILLVYEDDETPVLLTNLRDERLLLPVFSTKEKLLAASAWMGIGLATRPKRILDQAEFLSSFVGHDIIVAADPYVHNGNTRFTGFVPAPAE